jgi:hypothetical protein
MKTASPIAIFAGIPMSPELAAINCSMPEYVDIQASALRPLNKTIINGEYEPLRLAGSAI